MIYKIENNKILVQNTRIDLDENNCIIILNKKEFQQFIDTNNIYINDTDINTHFSKLEDVKKYYAGSFNIPKKNNHLAISFKYYIINNNIIFVDENSYVEKVIEDIIQSISKQDYDLAKFMHDFLETMIKDDLMYLEQIEHKLSILEDEIIKSDIEDFNEIIIKDKKEVLKFYHYYGQLIEVGNTFVEKNIFEQQANSLFELYVNRVTRLQNETLLLREYTHQLQDLYESQINLHQNHIMKILTIVTTIFMPLTLITGWYGMNFKHMPELGLKYAYPMILGVFILIIIICLIIFKKKKFW